MNILILCTYPIKNPLHGGQIRVHNLVKAYKEAGHKVQVAGVLGSEHYPKEKGFVEFPGHDVLSGVIENLTFMEDYATSKLFSSNDRWFKKLSDKIDTVPDVIHVEQPWFYPFVKRYIRENNVHAKVIYGSQNIEYALKSKIVGTTLGRKRGEQAGTLIHDLELYVIDKADAVICVSKGDFEWISKQDKKLILLADNGVNDWKVTTEGIAQAKELSQEKKFAIYCASGYPPNITGFYEIFGNGFGSLTPEQALVVAGSAGSAIMADERFSQSANLKERMITTGIIEQTLLHGLLELSHCNVLPLTQGGGTNLKTAEALLSGKYIIATSIAMRGFEDFIGDDGIFIENDPSAFKKKLRHVMALNPFVLSEKDRVKRQRVLWKNCLKDLPAFAENIVTPQVENVV